MQRRVAAPNVEVIERVAEIINHVRESGDVALLDVAITLGDITPGDPHLIGREQMQSALASLDSAERIVLESAAERIRMFSEAQRSSIKDCSIPILGGVAGHTIMPIESAACYAPGGRYPLPSSVLMTVIPARVAGVERVWVISPRPGKYTLAAAAIAGADGVLAIGGAHAIAAVAFGTATIPRFDIVVGPGNKWVTMAKQQLCGQIAIDMLAGPSELLIIADEFADPAFIAADLLAQAEHDPDARVGLIAFSEKMIAAVDQELMLQLTDLPTKEIAQAAIIQGSAVLATDVRNAAEISNAIAPEHLSLHIRDSEGLLPLLRNYGALFIGSMSAEVFGDYGLGPNHVLPTGMVARSRGGLSVFDFLSVRTWMQLDEVTPQTSHNIADFARMEGLEAHARSSLIRTGSTRSSS
jgi:histidinol dehydrogenase